jgi:hypothetical protein
MPWQSGEVIASEAWRSQFEIAANDKLLNRKIIGFVIEKNELF